MAEHSIYELLGRFIPFFASFVWMFLMSVSLTDIRTRREQQIKRLSVLFFALFALGSLLSMLEAYFTSTLLGVLMPVVLICFPVIGYRLVWYMTGTVDDFRYLRHAILPVVYLLFLIAREFMGREPLDYLYLIVALLFTVSYLLLSLGRIRKYQSELDAQIKETQHAKQWHRFVTNIAFTTMLSPLLILIPQTTTFGIVVSMILMFVFVGVNSYLCYCSVFMDYAQSMPINAVLTIEPIEPVAVKPQRRNRRISKVSKNANGKLETEPLTRKRFEEYIKKEKPYLNANFKMTDLEGALSTNRTFISNFINRTYKMNFNRYINHLRIKEVERLKKRSDSERCTLTELVCKAGFSSTLHYSRAINIEKL